MYLHVEKISRSSRPVAGRPFVEVPVPEFGLRRLSHVLAPLAALTLVATALAMAACLAGGAQARAASNFSLLILPDQGENVIYSFVNSATSSINVTIYELKDT